MHQRTRRPHDSLGSRTSSHRIQVERHEGPLTAGIRVQHERAERGDGGAIAAGGILRLPELEPRLPIARRHGERTSQQADRLSGVAASARIHAKQLVTQMLGGCLLDHARPERPVRRPRDRVMRAGESVACYEEHHQRRGNASAEWRNGVDEPGEGERHADGRAKQRPVREQLPRCGKQVRGGQVRERHPAECHQRARVAATSEHYGESRHSDEYRNTEDGEPPGVLGDERRTVVRGQRRRQHEHPNDPRPQ